MPVSVQFEPPYTAADLDFGHRLLEQAATLIASHPSDDALSQHIRQAATRSQGGPLMRKVAEFSLAKGRGPTRQEIQQELGGRVNGMMMSLNKFHEASGTPRIVINEYQGDSASPTYVISDRNARAVLR